MVTVKSFEPVVNIITSFDDLMTLCSTTTNWKNVKGCLEDHFVGPNNENGIEFLKSQYNIELDNNTKIAEADYSKAVKKWDDDKKIFSLVKIPKKWKHELTPVLKENDRTQTREVFAHYVVEQVCGWRSHKYWKNETSRNIVCGWYDDTFGYGSNAPKQMKELKLFSVDFVTPDTSVTLNGFGISVNVKMPYGSTNKIHFSYDGIPYSYRGRTTKGSGTSSVDYIRKHMIGAAEQIKYENMNKSLGERKTKRMNDIVRDKLGGNIDWDHTVFSRSPNGNDIYDREYRFNLMGMKHITFAFKFKSKFDNPELDDQIDADIFVHAIDSSALKKMDIGMALVLFGQMGDK